MSLDRAQQAYKSEDYRQAHEIYTRLLEGAEREGNYNCLTYLYLRLGKVYNRLSVYRQAINSFRKYLDIIGQGTIHKDRASALSGIALAEAKLGNYDRAHAAELAALRTGELMKDTNTITRSLYQLGSLYFEQNNLEMALEYYFQVMDIALDTDNERQQMSILGAIGSLYSAKGDLQQAKVYLYQTLQLAHKLQRETTLAYALSSLGTVHAQLGEPDIALGYMKQSLERREAIGDKNGVITDKYNMANLYLNQRKEDQSENVLLEALELAQEINAKGKLIEIYSLLATLCEMRGQYKKAVDYLKKYGELKDQVFDEETARIIQDQQLVYDMEKREMEINRLKDQEARLQQQQINSRLKMTIVLVAFILTILLAGITFHFNRKLRFKNQSLQDSSQRIEEQNIQLAKYNEELKNFAYVASHDLKEPLRTINSFTNLLERRYMPKLDETAKEYMGFINHGVARMKQLLEDLLNYSRVDRTEAQIAPVDSRRMLDEALLNLQSDIQSKKAQIYIQSETEFPVVSAVPSHIIQIFQNLIGNALKFTNGQKPVVKVQHRQQSADWSVFSITDNGIGIEPDFKEKIFEMFARLHTQSEYQGSGIGLATCKKIVERYGGDIWVESAPTRGSTFYFTLPNERSRTS